MIRSRIKTGAARFMSQTGVGALLSSWAGTKGVPVVVNYHRVVENFEESAKNSIPSMLVSRSMLEEHLDWIGRRFRFVSLDELGERIGNKDGRGDPVAAVTFDDGYRDFYDHALPLLKQKGIPAAVFVVTDLVGTKRLQMHDKLYLLLTQRFRPNSGAPTPFQATRALLENLTRADLENLIRALETDVPLSEEVLQPFHSLTWEMLGEIHRAGMTVGSHGQSHALMTNESRQNVMREAAVSRSEIEARLGTVVQHFAYPGGCFDDAAVEAVAAAGYRFAYTTCGHQHASLPRLTIPRSVFWENSSSDSHGRFSGAVLNCQINHAFSLLGGCRQRHGTGQEHEHGRV
jgi:peptidoglycan/xylan/chitin deacetylase (PgdA/CDA1 family)